MPETKSCENGKSGATSFQDELKQNLRSPEIAQKEENEKQMNYALETAKYDLTKIKKQLVENAKAGKYTVANGITTVSCIYDGNMKFSWYMRIGRLDNGDEISANQKKIGLLRDPSLKYRVWKTFQVESKHSAEYYQYSIALEQAAAQEKIKVEFIVQNCKTGECYPFPSKVEDTYNMTYCKLVVRASTVIARNQPTQSHQSKPVEVANVKQPEKTQTSMQTQPSKVKRSDGEVVLRCILAVALCIATFSVCLSSDIGQFGMALLLIGAAIGGYYIVNK